MTILIVGGGPTGLTAALTLLQNGVPVRIIDREPAFHVGQRGAIMHPRSQEIFRFLGALPPIDAKAIEVPPMRIYALPGATEVIKDFELVTSSEPSPSVPRPGAKLIGQSVVEGILRDELAKYGCQVELNTELLDLVQLKDCVAVHILKKSQGQENIETAEYDFVVGADGAKGAIRKQTELKFLGHTDESTQSVLADVKLTGLDRSHWHLWGDAKDKLVTVRPAETEGEFWMVISGQFFHEYTGRRDVEVSEFLTFGEWKLNVRMVDKFGEGRVFVVGDAAHVHSPMGGQGMNSGILDCINLGWKLAHVYKAISPQLLLASYTEERLPVIAQMLNMTSKLQTVTVRKTGLSGLGDETKKDFAQLGVNYRRSSIVIDDRYPDKDESANPYGRATDGHLHAGDRAPEAPGLINQASGDVISLFDLFRPTRHTILVFNDRAGKAAEIIKVTAGYPPEATLTAVIIPAEATSAPRSTLTLCDSEGHAHQGYEIKALEPTVVIVRPDGFIGAIVRYAEGLQKYFRHIFV